MIQILVIRYVEKGAKKNQIATKCLHFTKAQNLYTLVDGIILSCKKLQKVNRQKTFLSEDSVMAVKIGDFLCSATKPVKVTNDQLNISTKHFKFQKNIAELNNCFLQQTLCDQCMFHFHGGRF